MIAREKFFRTSGQQPKRMDQNRSDRIKLCDDHDSETCEPRRWNSVSWRSGVFASKSFPPSNGVNVGNIGPSVVAHLDATSVEVKDLRELWRSRLAKYPDEYNYEGLCDKMQYLFSGRNWRQGKGLISSASCRVPTNRQVNLLTSRATRQRKRFWQLDDALVVQITNGTTTEDQFCLPGKASSWLKQSNTKFTNQLKRMRHVITWIVQGQESMLSMFIKEKRQSRIAMKFLRWNEIFEAYLDFQCFSTEWNSLFLFLSVVIVESP